MRLEWDSFWPSEKSWDSFFSVPPFEAPHSSNSYGSPFSLLSLDPREYFSRIGSSCHGRHSLRMNLLSQQMSAWAYRISLALVEWTGPLSPGDWWELEGSQGLVGLLPADSCPCWLEGRWTKEGWKELGRVWTLKGKVLWLPKMGGWLLLVDAGRERIPSWVAGLAAGMVKVPSWLAGQGKALSYLEGAQLEDWVRHLF